MKLFEPPGHIAERLSGVFLTYLLDHTDIKVLYKQVVYFEDVVSKEFTEKLKPAFATNCTPIVLSFNDYYSQFAAASIQSIVDSSSPSNNYDIIALCNEVTQVSKDRLLTIIKNHPNFSLRFYDPSYFIGGYDITHFNLLPREAYYRYAVPWILDYHKAIYLDCDTSVLRDIADFYQIDIGDNYVGGAIDIAPIAYKNYPHEVIDRTNYLNLGLKDLRKYVNSGDLLMNLDSIKRDFMIERFLCFNDFSKRKFLDQDVLNVLFEGHIFMVDQRWNFLTTAINGSKDDIDLLALKDVAEAYFEARKIPFILHYVAHEAKPWAALNLPFSDYFWVAFKNPFLLLICI